MCLEQRVQEHDLVWIKRVVPLVSGDDAALVGRALIGRRGVPTGRHRRDRGRHRRAAEGAGAQDQDGDDPGDSPPGEEQPADDRGPAAAPGSPHGSPEVAEQLRESIGRIISIAVVHEFLSSRRDQRHQHSRGLPTASWPRCATASSTTRRPINLSLEGMRSFTLPAQQATSCALIINELVQNAVEHAFVGLPGGSIVVRLAEQGDSLYVEIQDDGRGLPRRFRSCAPGRPRTADRAQPGPRGSQGRIRADQVERARRAARWCPSRSGSPRRSSRELADVGHAHPPGRRRDHHAHGPARDAGEPRLRRRRRGRRRASPRSTWPAALEARPGA